MNLVTRQELDHLMTASGGPCVSIYAPMHRAGAETQQNPIRFKNLIRVAGGELEARGMSAQAARELLAPAAGLIEDHPFWQHQSDGLAVFVAAGFARSYRLPLSFDELAAVRERFYLKPLLPLLTGDGRFYLLALSQNRVRLLTGTRHSAGELDLGDAPQSLADALGHELTRPNLQLHTATAGEGGILHGQAFGDEDAKEEIRRFFHRLNAGIGDLLKDRKAPLVLAGVEYLLPIYREVSSYPHLVEGGITGNPNDLSDDELHRRAWELVEPVFLRERREAESAYAAKAGTGQASAALEEIVPAAFDGRIETLFVALGTEARGRFDPATRELRLEDGNPAGGASEDLLDSAAIQTLLHGGKVYAVPQDRVPAGGKAAAVFRY